jgi:hypothetical protein
VQIAATQKKPNMKRTTYPFIFDNLADTIKRPIIVMYTRDVDSAAFFLNLQPTLLNPAVQLSEAHLPPQFH